VLRFPAELDRFFFNLDIQDVDNLWHRENLNLCFLPRAFQYQAESFDSRFHFVGRCLKRPHTVGWKDKSNGAPIVLVTDSQGSGDHSYFQAMARALGGSKYRVILSVGEQVSDAALEPLPDNCEINRTGSHLEILPRTSLVICQVGMGITFEAIYNGVPIIALPIDPGHAEVAVADRIIDLGLGLRLDRNALTTDVIRNAVEEVTSDVELRCRVKEMQSIFRVSSGNAAAIAADKIEEFGRTRVN
jgi:MGT family glycosyltransferase